MPKFYYTLRAFQYQISLYCNSKLSRQPFLCFFYVAKLYFVIVSPVVFDQNSVRNTDDRRKRWHFFIILNWINKKGILENLIKKKHVLLEKTTLAFTRTYADKYAFRDVFYFILWTVELGTLIAKLLALFYTLCVHMLWEIIARSAFFVNLHTAMVCMSPPPHPPFPPPPANISSHRLREHSFTLSGWERIRFHELNNWVW